MKKNEDLSFAYLLAYEAESNSKNNEKENIL